MDALSAKMGRGILSISGKATAFREDSRDMYSTLVLKAAFGNFE
jgi:hypothetical protein